MNLINSIRAWLRYFFRAQTKFKLHSPFVYEFVDEVLESDRHYYAFDELEALREHLLKQEQEIEVTDLGAGSTVHKSNVRKIKDIAKTALTDPKTAQFLFRFIHHYKPQTLLEFGSSLGLTTLYQSFPNTKAKLYTLEGCPKIAHIAKMHIDHFKLENVELVVGDFDKTLEPTLAKIDTLDYVFFDGNHRKEPTLAYFEACIKKAHSKTIFVFDDIYWSEDMKEAWEIIKADERVKLSIDLFELGLVFFRKEMRTKENFTLIRKKYKPWLMGFFD